MAEVMLPERELASEEEVRPWSPGSLPKEKYYTGKTCVNNVYLSERVLDVKLPERELYRKYGHGRPGSFPKEKYTVNTCDEECAHEC
jgi:hypothetical protein